MICQEIDCTQIFDPLDLSNQPTKMGFFCAQHQNLKILVIELLSLEFDRDLFLKECNDAAKGQDVLELAEKTPINQRLKLYQCLYMKTKIDNLFHEMFLADDDLTYYYKRIAIRKGFDYGVIDDGDGYKLFKKFK